MVTIAINLEAFKCLNHSWLKYNAKWSPCSHINVALCHTENAVITFLQLHFYTVKLLQTQAKTQTCIIPFQMLQRAFTSLCFFFFSSNSITIILIFFVSRQIFGKLFLTTSLAVRFYSFMRTINFVSLQPAACILWLWPAQAALLCSIVTECQKCIFTPTTSEFNTKRGLPFIGKMSFNVSIWEMHKIICQSVIPPEKNMRTRGHPKKEVFMVE